VNTGAALGAERDHLANLLEAVQRCAHRMQASAMKLAQPNQDLHAGQAYRLHCADGPCLPVADGRITERVPMRFP